MAETLVETLGATEVLVSGQGVREGLALGLALFALVELEKALLRWRDGRKGFL